MMMHDTVKIITESHQHNGLTREQIIYAMSSLPRTSGLLSGGGFLPKGVSSVTVELPETYGEVESALYGPVCGDDPIPESHCTYLPRTGHVCASRIYIGARVRMTRQVTVVVGPHRDEPHVLYAAFSGPMAEKEIHEDPSDEAFAFWETHALAILPYLPEGAVDQS